MRPLAVLAAAALLSLALPAQEKVRVTATGPAPGVVRLGQAARVEIKIVGSTVRADVYVPEVDGVSMRLGQPSTMHSQTIVNGRLSSTSYTTYDLFLTPSREGKFAIPAIEVRVGDDAHRIRQMEFEAVKDMRGEEHAFLVVTPSSERVYVHEPIRFEFDYGINDGLRIGSGRTNTGASYQDIDIQAAWLEDLDGAVAIEEDGDPRYTEYLVRNQRFLQPVETTRSFKRGARSFNRYRFTKSFLPTSSGKRKLAPAMLRFGVESGRRRRGIFGEVLAGATEDYYSYGEPIEFEVLPIPEDGRPTNYYGAVGRFEISAALNRGQVKVGNSMKLILSITGRGNTEFLRVPELDDVDGFHLLGKTEERVSDRVTVTYDLTPLSADVQRVPSIEWNFFDTTPGVERFVTVATEPLAIEVVPLAEGESLAALPGEERAPVTPGVDDIFDMKSGAGAAVAERQAAPALGMRAVIILAPWLLCGLLLGWFSHMARRRADVSGLRSRGAARRFKRKLAEECEPVDALVSYLADRMGVAEAAVIGPDLRARLATAGVEAALASRVQECVDGALAARYGGGGGLDVATASELVDLLEQQQVNSLASAVAGVMLALMFCGSLGAQVGAGESAYRRGDYAAAAEAFGREAEAPEADAHAVYNLGNSLYRLGRLGEALVAYERARLAMPRDEELLANIALVRQQLELGTGEGEPFSEAVGNLRASFTGAELLWICVLCNAMAAGCLVLGYRRGVLRVLGFVALVPSLLLIAELLWLGPGRPPAGFVVKAKASVVAEPRQGLEAVLELREGAEVTVLAEGPAWTRVEVQGRTGYVAAGSVGVVR